MNLLHADKAFQSAHLIDDPHIILRIIRRKIGLLGYERIN